MDYIIASGIIVNSLTMMLILFYSTIVAVMFYSEETSHECHCEQSALFFGSVLLDYHKCERDWTVCNDMLLGWVNWNKLIYTAVSSVVFPWSPTSCVPYMLHEPHMTELHVAILASETLPTSKNDSTANLRAHQPVAGSKNLALINSYLTRARVIV